MNENAKLRTRRHLVRMAVAAAAAVPVVITASSKGYAQGFSRGDPPPGRGPGGHPDHPPHPDNPHHPGPAACFLAGTLIRTSTGERTVESLRIGDPVLTLRGEQPIRWIGRNRFRKSAGHARFGRAHPIRIARGALGAATPSRELYISGDHAVYVDGALIPVKLLENGKSIAFADMTDVEEISYFHLEFDRHEVVFAEGAPTESLLVYEPAVRERFSNFIEHERLYGAVQEDAMEPFAPVLRYTGFAQEAEAMARLAISSLVDVRDRLQVIYDRIAERVLVH